jgi:hypothetical protein
MRNKLNLNEDVVEFSGTFSLGKIVGEFNLGASMSFMDVGREAGRAMAEKIMAKIPWPAESEMIASIENEMREAIKREIVLQMRGIAKRKLKDMTVEQILKMANL